MDMERNESLTRFIRKYLRRQKFSFQNQVQNGEVIF
jgi:hypothetical protein